MALQLFSVQLAKTQHSSFSRPSGVWFLVYWRPRCRLSCTYYVVECSHVARYWPYAHVYYNRSCALSSLDDKGGLGLPGLILRNGQVVLSTWFWRGETSAQMRCFVVPTPEGEWSTNADEVDELLVTWCHLSRPADAGSECLKSGSAVWKRTRQHQHQDKQDSRQTRTLPCTTFKH